MLTVKSNRRAAYVMVVLLAVAACGCSWTDEAGRADNGEAAGASPPIDSGGETPQPPGNFHLGEPRDDLERYLGLYGDPGRGQFFVAEARRPEYAEQAPEIPPGYLAIGAMWGDVAPMHMKSHSEMKFEQVDLSDFAPDEPSVAQFEFGPDGRAVALTFTSGGMSEFGRRPRVGDLPADWR